MDVARVRPSTAVSYTEVRVAYQTIRMVAASAGVVAALVASIALGSPTYLVAAPLALLVAGHAYYRLRRPDSDAMTSLIIDGGALITVAAIAGAIHLGMGIGLAYLVVAAVMMLPRRRAYVFSICAVAFAVLAVTYHPLASAEARHMPVSFLAESMVGAAALAALLLLLPAVTRKIELVYEQLESALDAERQAGQSKDEFVSMVSHELRTPLTSIAGFAETLKDTWQGLDQEEVNEFLSIIIEESRHLSRLVEDVLVIPRLEAGRLRLEPTSFELRPLAYRISERIIPGGGIKYVSVAIDSSTMVHGDTKRVEQVLRNLLENARKYGGDQILVEGEERGDHYLVVVSDNGPGIPEVDSSRVFEHFEQLSKGDGRTDSGIGLGLPIARKLARAMGGDLWYEPRFPTGARFCFTLRLSPERPTAERTATVGPTPQPEVRRLAS